MKKLVLATSLVLSLNSLAHLDNGIYRGTTASGTTCEFLVKSESFRNNIKHPVNEQVFVEFNGEAFTLGHKTSLAQTNQIQIEGEFLSAFNGVQGGTTALQVAMIHSETYSGPKEFRFVANYKDSSKNQVVFCQDLKFVE